MCKVVAIQDIDESVARVDHDVQPNPSPFCWRCGPSSLRLIMREPRPPYNGLFSKLLQTTRSLMFWLGLFGHARGLLSELMRRRQDERARHRGKVRCSS